MPVLTEIMPTSVLSQALAFLNGGEAPPEVELLAYYLMPNKFKKS